MKDIKYSFTVIMAAFLVAGICVPVSFTEEGLSLRDAVNEALEANPEILSAKRAYEAADARIWQAASLNDPMLGFEYDKINADRMLTGKPMSMYSISQDVPFPTKLYLRAKVASKLAKMAYENYKMKERDVAARVKSAYAELFVVYRSIEINKENKSILDQLSRTANARYSAGKGTQADVLKAQVELAAVDTELITLETKRLVAQARINVLLNKDPKDEIGAPAPEGTIKFEQTLDECYSLAEKNNPELKAYGMAIEKGKAAYDLAVSDALPDMKLEFRQMVGNGSFKDNQWAGMLGVTVPLWFFEKNVFSVKEMRSELEMLKAEYAAKQKEVLFDIRDAYARVDANRKLVELYETAFLPQAEETLNASITGYESDRMDFLTLLDSRRTLMDFKLKHYNALLDLRIALADLERTIGADIDLARTAEEAVSEKK